DALNVVQGQIVQLRQARLAAPYPAREGRPYRSRLLVDLLEHEVGVARLLSRGLIPGDAARLAVHRAPRFVEERDAVRVQEHQLALPQTNDIASLLQERRHV